MQNPGVNTLKKTECNQNVLLFVRYPEKGRVKTRLETHLDQDKILHLYRYFVEDVLSAIKKSGFSVTICYLPPEREREIKAWLGPASAYAPQTGADLGQRMGNAFMQAFTRTTSPADQALLIGSDFPDLDSGILDQAFDSLSQNDMTLGPAVDGGYYLIGFNRLSFIKEVFDNVSWGTGQVFPETMQKVDQAGLKVHVLPEWQDIDTFEDLELFYRRAHENGLEHLETVQYLQTIFSRNP